jgi:hypothetical protein
VGGASRESEKGETEGRKDRPATVVLVTSRTGFGEIVYLLPISTSEPKPDDPWKIEIPPSIKERLGLNVSAWTPFHLRPTRKATGKDNSAQETCLYCYLPSGFFRKVVDVADEYRRTHKPRLVAR